ncbi:peptidyl-tRNA hydrolase [Gordonia araii NBRC 100433]|uniref:Peptidyl-tRNA hydrolase n=1 Tax=Gordonia araii NBRC 100433 TaxID=1073574 RepID=G7H663_9ACTN|nr:aminoacyl-tRNA hydrolase [Gordonia araii]NNG98702.1 aminoacyl-tRNA hydrolase [Gordonia araii NBRC 100433]GAB11302.1 peptidyl-tRNA hydrolase [Gordonia araii NBRC 100433]
MKLVIGLGNPGPRYEKTRHNIGAMVVDRLAAAHGARWSTHKRSGAETASINLAGEPVLLGKSRTYMNDCGRHLGPLAKFYSIDPADIVVAHDELDIDFGQVRLKRGGGEGGHNGLRSLSAALGTRDYARVRLGIGRPPGRQDPAEFVLKPFPSRDRDAVELLIGNGADATELLIGHGLEAAQNAVHAW